MRTKILLLFLLGWVGMVFGQISQSEKENAKKEILKLNSFHKKFKTHYDETNEKLTKLKQNFSGQSLDEDYTKLLQHYKEAKKYNDTLARNYQLFLANKTILLDKGISEQEIDEWFGYKNDVFSKTVKQDKPVDTNVYMYFGENKVLKEDILKDKNDEASQILRNVINNKGKQSYFGDITIPKNNQKFYFYKYIDRKTIKETKEQHRLKESLLNNERDMNKALLLTKELQRDTLRNKFILERKADKGDYILDPLTSFKFKRLDVEIKDGYFCDIRVFVEDEQENLHVFTNQIGISILFFSDFGTNKMMNYKSSIRKKTYNVDSNYTDEKMKNLYISLSDVMNYSYKVGNHYIPHDIALELPTKPDENEKGNAIYQIKQETYLEKILELRAYTDFLTLFGNSQNGLAQVEGKAKFYLFPYPFRFLGSKRTLGQIEYFPAVSPFVNYSRFEKDSRYVKTAFENGNFIVKNDIDLIEKRYLMMGLDLEVLKWQNKNAPVSLSLYGLLNYNISEMNINVINDTITKSVKAMGFGGGLHLSTKRFNNFGFDYKAEFSWFDFKNFNPYQNQNITLPSIIPIFRNEAEVFYHPNGSPNQAIFARLITYNYLGKTNDQSFYQFQFGYKFAIGNRTVNAKN